jgi:hypothetical protein
LAAKSRDADAIKRWLQMAADYDQLAESMASISQVARGAPRTQRVSMQQQASQEPESRTPLSRPDS